MKEPLLSGKITSITKCRTPLYQLGLTCDSLPIYHTYSVLEVNNGEFQLLIERSSDQMVMMIGDGAAWKEWIWQFRPDGSSRVRDLPKIVKQATAPVKNEVTVRTLVARMSKSLASRWKPYRLLWNKCQHFKAELHALLNKNSGTGKERKHRSACC